MTKTLVALALIAGGILLVTRFVDTDKPMPAQARRLRARTKCLKLDAGRRLSQPATLKPNILVVDPKDRHASRSRKSLQRVRCRRTRYE